MRQRGPGETPDCQGTSPVETPVSPTHHALDQEPEPSLHLSSENRNPPDDATPGPTHGHSCTLTRCWAAPRDTQALTRLGALVILFPPSPRPGSRGGGAWLSESFRAGSHIFQPPNTPFSFCEKTAVPLILFCIIHCPNPQASSLQTPQEATHFSLTYRIQKIFEFLIYHN